MLYVFLESATNPFLTNPIGMAIVLLSLVVLKRLASMPPPVPGAWFRPGHRVGRGALMRAARASILALGLR